MRILPPSFGFRSVARSVGLRPTRRAVTAVIGIGVAAAVVLGSVQTSGVAATGVAATGGLPIAGSVRASTSTTQACSVDSRWPKRQFRGTWITTVSNADWPSRPGLTVTTQKLQLDAILNRAKAAGMNAVMLQVRPMADAFWPSPYEPWSKFLTGTQGKNPGYDPLAYAVAAAHQRNLQLHAWFNPYRIGPSAGINTLAATHPARRHPDWVLRYAGTMYYNPGVPAARKFVETAIMDAVRRYDIDGVHFDDYFYPYPESGYLLADWPQYQAYRTAGGTLTRPDWRRLNVNLFVKEMSDLIHRTKPWLAYGISPFGVWRNVGTDSRGSRTRALQSYDDLYADSRLWAMIGWVDYLAPQVYWNQGYAIADYNMLAPWWNLVALRRNVNMFVGQAVYRVGNESASSPWNTKPSELSNHLARNAGFPALRGDIWFSSGDVTANKLNAMGIVKTNWYHKPALTPQMPWRDGLPPAPVTQLQARNLNSATYPHSAWLTWAPGSADTAQVQVFRIPGRITVTSAADCRLADNRYLLGIVRSHSGLNGFVDRGGVRGQLYTYVLVPTDRFSNQATPRVAYLTY